MKATSIQNAIFAFSYTMLQQKQTILKGAVKAHIQFLTKELNRSFPDGSCPIFAHAMGRKYQASRIESRYDEKTGLLYLTGIMQDTEMIEPPLELPWKTMSCMLHLKASRKELEQDISHFNQSPCLHSQSIDAEMKDRLLVCRSLLEKIDRLRAICLIMQIDYLAGFAHYARGQWTDMDDGTLPFTTLDPLAIAWAKDYEDSPRLVFFFITKDWKERFHELNESSISLCQDAFQKGEIKNWNSSEILVTPPPCVVSIEICQDYPQTYEELWETLICGLQIKMEQKIPNVLNNYI